MSRRFSDASSVSNYVNEQLAEAADSPAHPWHWPVLVTQTAGRIIVLRAYELALKQAIFFTDFRSAKVEQLLEGNGQCVLVFYNPEHRTQLRLRGEASLLLDADRRERFWRKLNSQSHELYADEAVPGSAYPPDYNPDDKPTTLVWTKELERTAYQNFAVYKVQALSADFLHIGAESLRRATWEIDTEDSFRWVVP